jgi:hypothetical protein
MKRIKLLLLLLAAGTVFAQDSVSIRFGDLAPGVRLGEEFASQGVHFVVEPPYSTSAVIAPPVLDPTRRTIAQGIYVAIRFDKPILSIHITVAAVDAVNASWLLTAQRVDGSFNNGDGGHVPPNQWVVASGNYTPEQPVETVYMQVWALQGTLESAPHLFYLDQMDITFVPEPSTWAFILVGSGALLIFARRRGRAGG